ncbi:Nudix family hydrolase [Luteimonas sp. SJ-92]|uniref:8-oxo-dGTP diphosphatase n=1 Tax=Luteimonas salinisoli TaxID=2752307 RepID=A0A853JHZ4_9GAMM|nr:Nudix family hydrolase [Luteimonas salinisoli]NZA28364.1 Nudix family hydrolase [Luteimonas salinisoli]
MPDARPVEVVAAAITDPGGRILLTRRTEGRDLAGLWEFPGGKREPGEPPEQALARELREELGIEADIGAELIVVPHAYPHKRLRLDVRHVTAWRGTPQGHEGQALAWVPRHRLPSYAMPAADRPVVAALLRPDRYLVTPEPAEGGDDAWLERLRQALANGVRQLHLRLHGLEQGRRERLVAAALDLCRPAGAQALVGADLALARATGAGLHLRAAQLAELPGRPLPAAQPVAASCHGAEELRHAERLGCDFAVLGSVAATPSHPDGPTLGWEGFAALREAVSLPLYAIGGLAPDDLPEARRHGAQGIAAIRSLWPPAPTR